MSGHSTGLISLRCSERPSHIIRKLNIRNLPCFIKANLLLSLQHLNLLILMAYISRLHFWSCVWEQGVTPWVIWIDQWARDLTFSPIALMLWCSSNTYNTRDGSMWTARLQWLSTRTMQQPPVLSLDHFSLFDSSYLFKYTYRCRAKK